MEALLWGGRIGTLQCPTKSTTVAQRLHLSRLPRQHHVRSLDELGRRCLTWCCRYGECDNDNRNPASMSGI
jgi:hypothetical protein